MACLSCKNLAVGYAGRAVASGISFEVNPGDMVCVVGENGAGKSTLVKTLLGLLPPIAGSLSLDAGALGASGSAGAVGYLPQKGESQRDFPASAGEIVLSGRVASLGRRAFYRREDRRLAAAALEQVGARDLRELPFSMLSGGQQQRVLIARALCSQARLLVLDEPTTGLDPDAAASLYDTLDGLRESGAALVVVSHDVGAAVGHATHVLALDAPPSFATAAEWRARGGRLSGAPAGRGAAR